MPHKNYKYNTNHFYPSDISEIKLYNRATVLKTVWFCFKNRHIDQWYRLRIPPNCLINGQKKIQAELKDPDLGKQD